MKENSLLFLRENFNTPTDMVYQVIKDSKDPTITQVDMTHTMGGSLVQKTPILSNDDGQSAVEFILTFAFAIGVTFLFVNQTLNMTDGYLVHYANFMSSRTYLVQESGIDGTDQNLRVAEQEATGVFRSYPLERFGIQATFKVNSPDTFSTLFSGTIVEFSKKLSSTPFLGGGDSAIFYSESFLGKEPTRFDCYRMMCAAITGSSQACRGKVDTSSITLYDNGC